MVGLPCFRCGLSRPSAGCLRSSASSLHTGQLERQRLPALHGFWKLSSLHLPVAILCPTRSYFAPHSLVFSQRSKISGAPSPCNSLLCKCPNPPILDTLTPSNPISVSSAPRDHCCLLGLRFVFLCQSLENAPRVNVLFPFFGRSQPLLSVVYCLHPVAPYILSSLVIFMLGG